VLEDRDAVRVIQVLVEPHAWAALAQDAGQRRLANFERLSAQVCAVQLQKIEGVEERLGLVPAMAQQLEGSDALLVATTRRRSGMSALLGGSLPRPPADSELSSRYRCG
jgi:hypothetical protein